MVAVSSTIAETSPWTLPVRATAPAILVLAVITAAGSRAASGAAGVKGLSPDR